MLRTLSIVVLTKAVGHGLETHFGLQRSYAGGTTVVCTFWERVALAASSQDNVEDAERHWMQGVQSGRAGRPWRERSSSRPRLGLCACLLAHGQTHEVSSPLGPHEQLIAPQRPGLGVQMLAHRRR